MIKTVIPIACIFDSEYVPCVDTGRRVYGLDDKLTHEEVRRVMYENAPPADPNAAAGPDGKPQRMMKLMFYKVVSISAIVRRESAKTGELPKLQWITLPDETRKTEPEILKAFTAGVGASKMQLVGFASQFFDVPVIAQRCLIHGVNTSTFFDRPNKPWEGADYLARNSDYHVDLAADLCCGSDGKARPKLDQICKAVGIPGKMGLGGAEVEAAYYSGRAQEIYDYNDFDTLSTYLLWAKMAALSGLVEFAAESAALEMLVRAQIAKGRKHLKQYVKAIGW